MCILYVRVKLNSICFNLFLFGSYLHSILIKSFRTNRQVREYHKITKHYPLKHTLPKVLGHTCFLTHQQHCLKKKHSKHLNVISFINDMHWVIYIFKYNSLLWNCCWPIYVTFHRSDIKELHHRYKKYTVQIQPMFCLKHLPVSLPQSSWTQKMCIRLFAILSNDHTTYFWNMCDIYKATKVVHRNWSVNQHIATYRYCY